MRLRSGSGVLPGRGVLAVRLPPVELAAIVRGPPAPAFLKAILSVEVDEESWVS